MRDLPSPGKETTNNRMIDKKRGAGAIQKKEEKG